MIGLFDGVKISALKEKIDQYNNFTFQLLIEGFREEG